MTRLKYICSRPSSAPRIEHRRRRLDSNCSSGKSFFNQKNYDAALSQLDAYVQESTTSVRVAEALYSAGMTLYNQQYTPKPSPDGNS